MSADTKIQWCHATFNPWRGCQRVSPGCEHCYAEALSVRNPKVLGEWGPKGARAIASESYWRQPLAWDRAAAKAGERRRVFCASLADVFEDRPDLRLPRARLWSLITRTPHLDWLILTKRAERARDWFTRWADLSGESQEPQLVRGPDETRKAHPSGRGQIFADMLEAMGDPPTGCAYPTFDWMEGPRWWPPVLDNVWLGVSVEDQQRADERIPVLLDTPAAVRFLSCEPLLGPIRLVAPAFARGDPWPPATPPPARPWLSNKEWPDDHDYWTWKEAGIGWIIVGGESGHGARPCDIGWVRSIVAQCKAAGVACFVKQLGAKPLAHITKDRFPLGTKLHVGAAATGDKVEMVLKDRKGGDPAEWPEDLRVREFPR